MAHPDGPYIDREPIHPLDPKQAINDGKGKDPKVLAGILNRVSPPLDSPPPPFPHLPPVHPLEKQFEGEIIETSSSPEPAPCPEDTVPLIDLYLVVGRAENSKLDLTPSLARSPADNSVGVLVENVLEKQRPSNFPARQELVKAQLEPPPLHPSISTGVELTLATVRVPANQVLVSDPGPVREVRRDIENRTIHDAQFDAMLFWQYMITLQEFLRSGTQMPIRVYVPLEVLGDFQPHEIAVSAMHPGLAKRSSASPSQPS